MRGRLANVVIDDWFPQDLTSEIPQPFPKVTGADPRVMLRKPGLQLGKRRIGLLITWARRASCCAAVCGRAFLRACLTWQASGPAVHGGTLSSKRH